MIAVDRAVTDRNLLGAALGDATSWQTWLAVLRAAFALPLSDSDAERFSRAAGARAPPTRRVRELWCVNRAPVRQEPHGRRPRR